MPDSTLATLSRIRLKVRRLTRSPSDSSLTDAQIDEYINTFILYDMPREFMLFDLKTTLTFWLKNNIDVYETSTVATDALYNFKNKYTSIHPPAYVDGNLIYFATSLDELNLSYPLVNNEITLPTLGDGVTTAFSGTLSTIPLLQNNVTFSSIDINNNALSAYDLPTDVDNGALLDTSTQVPLGTIDYLTGAYTITWPTAPKNTQPIVAHYPSYVAGQPDIMLFYDNKFYFRPVPDQPYRFTVQAYIRPTELLSTSQQPEIAQWWQYIAYGAAKKVFEDRNQIDEVQRIMPELENQGILVNRKTHMMAGNKRTATIFAHQAEPNNRSPWEF